MNTNDQLRYNIRKLRELRGYSQEYMATEIGVSTKSYSRIENSQCQLSVPRLERISEILEVPVSEIFSFSAEQLLKQKREKN